MKITLQKLIDSNGSVLDEYEAAGNWWRNILGKFYGLPDVAAKPFLRKKVKHEFSDRTDYGKEVLVWALFAMLHTKDARPEEVRQDYARKTADTLRKLKISEVFTASLNEVAQFYQLN